MKILNYCLAACIVFGLAACHRTIQSATSATSATSVAETVAPIVKDTVVVIPDLVHTPVLEMSKTPCFGSCPVFVVKIYASGLVQWEGIKNVRRIGKFTTDVPAGWLDDLLKTAENHGFYKMAHRYPSNGTTVPDLPQTTITISTHERGRYSVTNIADAPLRLLEFQRDFEEKLEGFVWKSVQ
jgi:hypothetical protein